MKILVADRISPIGVDLFKAEAGFEVIEAYGSSPEQLLELVKDVDAIALRSDTRVTAEVVAAAPKLKVVGRAGVGVDNIDIEAATDGGVIVMNTPTGNTLATAELTFTHMLAGTRPIVQAAAQVRKRRRRCHLVGDEGFYPARFKPRLIQESIVYVLVCPDCLHSFSAIVERDNVVRYERS